MTLLRVESLRVTYGGAVLALDDVSFEVPDDGAVVLLGANGAGKTTALRAVSGLLRFHGGQVARGSVTFEGRSIVGADTAGLVASGIAQVLEGRRIFGDLTVAENLRAGGFAARSRPGNEARSRDHVLSLFPILGERLQQRAGFLSGGEQQMLAIGRALMARPRLLLLDEPSLGLAPLVVVRIAEVLRQITDDGVALLLVDQNTALALTVTRDAYLLETGRVRAHRLTRELVADDRVRASYLGTGAGGALVEAEAQEVARGSA